jgi:hypothetical protein
MKKIYADTDVCCWHASQLNLEILEKLTQDYPAIFHIPYPYDPLFEIKISEAVAVCSQVIILISELHCDSAQFMINFQHPKIKYFVCGTVEGYNNTMWMDWFISSSYFYKNNPQVLAQLTPYTPKVKTFDILLGRRKPHRSQIFDYINSNNLSEHVIMTYLQGNDTMSLQEQDSTGWIWEDGLDLPNHQFNWTVTPIEYFGETMSLSQVIPVNVYNQTAYSIVAETNFDNHYSFYTEKIVKPILAKRLFIAFSGQYYLRNLRSLGFQTFDGIIDESYDAVEDHAQRFESALEQMKYLISQPQQEILNKIKSITAHNSQVMLGTDWYGDFSKELQAFLLAHTN